MARTPANSTKYHEQYIENFSFDDEFGVRAVEMIGYDGTNMVRVAVDSTGALKIV